MDLKKLTTENFSASFVEKSKAKYRAYSQK